MISNKTSKNQTDDKIYPDEPIEIQHMDKQEEVKQIDSSKKIEAPDIPPIADPLKQA